MKTQIKDTARKIAALLLALVLTVLSAVVLVVYDRSVRGARSREADAFNARNAGLIAEYRRTERGMARNEALYKEYSVKGRKKSLLIFNQCNENLYDQVYATLQKKKVAGVFVLSEEETVGMEGCISLAQYRSLVSAGWLPALKLPKDAQRARDFIEKEKAYFNQAGLAFPTAVYFAVKEYSSDVFGMVKEEFNTFFYHVDDVKNALPLPTMTSPDDPIGIPYLYTSRIVSVSDRYYAYVRSGNSMSISTGRIISNSRFMESARLGLDTTMVNLLDIAETVTGREVTCRSAADYRAQEYLVQTEYAEKTQQYEALYQELKRKKEELFVQILSE